MNAPSQTTFATANGLPSTVRAHVVEVLDRRLADAIDLSGQLKQAHWNVKGPQFAPLHLLFDAVHNGLEEDVDLLAERVVQLGGVAHGTARAVASASALVDYPRTAVLGAEHLAAVTVAIAQFGTLMRTTSDECSTLGDQDSADICTEVSRGIDKWLWMVEAHGQDRPAARPSPVLGAVAVAGGTHTGPAERSDA